MLNYLDEDNPNCSTKHDLQSFYSVCEFLQIPYEILDFRKEYEEKILNYIYE
jgi:tRNA U34 2-thiouridine synthase MnmA/TrmU